MQKRQINHYSLHDFNNKISSLITNLELIDLVLGVDLDNEIDELNRITLEISEMIRGNSPVTSSTILIKLREISEIYDLTKQKTIPLLLEAESDPKNEKEELVYLTMLSQAYSNLKEFLLSDIKINVAEYLKTFFDSYIEMLSKSMGINLSVTTIDELPDFFMFKEDITTIFEELIKNSMDSLLNSDQEEKRINVRFSISESEDQERHLQIDHYDNGPGVEIDNQERIFKEDFTTKKSGSGKGLNGILVKLKRYSGTIELDKFFTDGAHFTIKIPIIRSKNTCPTIAT